MKKNKDSVEKKYVELAKKLGKIPSRRDAKSLLGVYIENFGAFKKNILEKHPHLEDLQLPAKLSDSDIEQYRLSLLKSKIKTGNKQQVQKASMLNFFEEVAKNAFSGNIKNVTIKPKKFVAERTHTLVLSDLHFGADIKGDETGTTNYGKIEEARRLAFIVSEAIEYKKQYKENTHLEILIIGDIIDGLLHDDRSGAVLAEQFARAVHLLSQAVAHLALAYPTVSVRCATGNHGRNMARHKTRAVHGKYDSIETMVYYALKHACSNLKNTTFFIPKTPLGCYEVYGKRIAYTHGDTVLNPGNPGSTVNTKAIETQVNKINAALPNSEEYAVFIYGHTHTPHLVYLSNGCVIIGNGSLPAPDSFAVSIGLYESHTGQFIFESTPGFAVGDVRLIKVHKNVDKSPEFDKIIKAWKEF